MNHAKTSLTTREGIRVENLVYGYDGAPVFDGLSFSLAAGKTLAVVGPSGCGKSTLLSLLAGLRKPLTGTVQLAGASSSASSASSSTVPRTSLILQDYGLFPWKTVYENIALPLELVRVSQQEQHEAVAAMLGELSLTGLEKRYPHQISGGQAQRVAIGRALITRPEIVLMDEPFSSLDALTREHLQNTVFTMWQRRAMTIVLVTHSVAEALFLGSSVMVLEGHPAKKCLWLENPLFGKLPHQCGVEAATVTAQIYEALQQPKGDGGDAGGNESSGNNRNKEQHNGGDACGA